MPTRKIETIPILLALTIIIITLSLLPTQTNSLIPFQRPSIFDLPFDDPFRILEQSPLSIPKTIDQQQQQPQLALARADWKETKAAHEITLDVPGMKKQDVKIEVEENRVLRVSGERKVDKEENDDKWHRVERTMGKFWRQFRLPNNVDLDKINARLDNGVLKIVVPKIGDERKRQPKVIDVVDGGSGNEGEVKASKAEM